MKFTNDFDVHTFKFWGGAEDTVEVILEAGKMDDLQHHLEEVFADKIPSATDINDYVWFEASRIFYWLEI